MTKYTMKDCLNCEEYAPHIYDMCGNCSVIKLGNIVQEIEHMPEYLMEVLRNA